MNIQNFLNWLDARYKPEFEKFMVEALDIPANDNIPKLRYGSLHTCAETRVRGSGNLVWRQPMLTTCLSD
tara:strand:+ start:3936 stop:4145 length:210 start_codon:yes stop_codon:yes gene_type:complete